MKKAILQVALDLVELKRALQIGQESLEGGADWIEVGIPLIKSEKMRAVRAFRERFPDATIVADMKVADTGTLEVEMAAKSGADLVCILADADDSVILEAGPGSTPLREPDNRGSHQCQRSGYRALESMGVDIICAHVGINQQMIGGDSVALLASLSGQVNIPLAVAGGIDAAVTGDAIRHGVRL